MTNAELVKVLAEKTEMKQTEIKRVIEAIDETVQEVLLDGDSVKLGTLGTFKLGYVAAKEERPNHTGRGAATIPAKAEHNKPKMQFSKGVKELIQNATLGSAYTK